MEVQILIQGVVLPAALATAILLLGFRPWQRKEHYQGGLWSGGIALALAFIVSFISQNGWESLQPNSKRDWIVYLALALGVIGLPAALLRKSTWPTWLAGPLLVLAITLIIKPLDNPTYALLGLPGLCGVSVILWFLLEPLARRRPGASLPISFLIIFTGIAIIAELTGGITFPIICGALSGVCGAAFVISLLNPRFSFHAGATPLLATMPPTILWLQGWYDYSGAPVACFLLPLLALPLLWLGELPVITRQRPWIGVVARVFLVTIPVAIAIVLVMNTQSSDPYSP